MVLHPLSFTLVLLPGFRANEPLYGLSLFSHRPGAPQYPFSVDISSRDGNFGKVDSNSWTPWLALAVASPALIHLTLMLAASHVSVKEDSEYGNAALIAYHKDRALVCLHQLLEDYNQTFSDEAIAAAAVLACYEVSTVGSLLLAYTDLPSSCAKTTIAFRAT